MRLTSLRDNILGGVSVAHYLGGKGKSIMATQRAIRDIRESYVAVADQAIALQGHDPRKFLGWREGESFPSPSVLEKEVTGHSRNRTKQASEQTTEAVREAYLAIADQTLELQKRNAGWLLGRWNYETQE